MKVYVSFADSALISKYQDGDVHAFETLLYRYKDRIYQTLFSIVKDTFLAEDLFQEAFIKIIDKLQKRAYNEEGKFLPWALRIAHNLAIDYIRKQKRKPLVIDASGCFVLDSVAAHDTFNSNFKLEQNENFKALEKMIEQLPDDQKEVLILRHYANKSFKEISILMGCSINTALGRMRYALINLRKMNLQPA